MDALLGELVGSLVDRPNAVLIAPPGSGKTTRVPPALSEHDWASAGPPGKTIVLQPRRVAARLAAQRMADERGEELGNTVGYCTRFERRTGPSTQIEVITEGLMVRRLQADPFLEGVQSIVLDELHERSLNTDLNLAFLREIQSSARPDLKLIVMSATLDPEPVVDFLGGPSLCASFSSQGRVYPVEIEFDARVSERPLADRVASAVVKGLRSHQEGHLLVFLPSVAEIERARRVLGKKGLGPSVEVLPLHGSLSPAMQDEALASSAGRKVVLATNVAETSITFEGVVRVIDSGLAVVSRFDSASGATRLGRERIARDSADQRAGRAGRTGPGVCHRMWTKDQDAQLARMTPPEIRRSDMSSVLLQLGAWGSSENDFGWFERPPPGTSEKGSELLKVLGAIGPEGVTPLGQRLASLPTHPRMGAALLRSHSLGVLFSVATVVALVEGREVLQRGVCPSPGEDDLSFRLRLIQQSEERGRPLAELRAGVFRELVRVRNQLVRTIERQSSHEGLWPTRSVGLNANAPAVLRSLAAGFSDRIAKRRSDGGEHYQLASGQGARLADDSGAFGQEYLLALAIDAGRRGSRREAWVRIAAAIEEDWLETEEAAEVFFDSEAEAVVSARVVRYQSIVISQRPSKEPIDPLAQSDVLEAAARARGAEALLRLDASVTNLLGRIATLAAVRPELEFPDLTSLDALLPGLCRGRRTLAQVRKAPLKPVVLELLNWRHREALDAELPERIQVPTGRMISLVYSRTGSPPVLAARIQQLFGMLETPTLAGGRIPLLIHLLAPNGRPAQVTQDLASFWTSTWPEVRRDLRGRYPKHSWPEDPSEAVPEDRPPRRRKKPKS